jgi:hypothetical protein
MNTHEVIIECVAQTLRIEKEKKKEVGGPTSKPKPEGLVAVSVHSALSPRSIAAGKQHLLWPNQTRTVLPPGVRHRVALSRGQRVPGPQTHSQVAAT